MSDDAQRPGTPQDTAPDGWASAGHGTDGTDRVAGGQAPGAPDGAGGWIPGASATPADQPSGVRLDKSAPDPWAPPVDPQGTVASGGGAPSGHARPTAVPPPGPALPGTPPQGPWAGPYAAPGPGRAVPYAAQYAAPGPGIAAPGNPFAPSPAAQDGPVPPPPIGPEGPGQVPYGFPQYTGHPGYGAPYGSQGAGYGWPGMPLPPSNGMGIASLVLGVISLVLFCLWPVALIVGVLAVIFGIIGRRRAGRGEATNGGMALAGLICGAVGFVLSAVLLIVLLAVPDDSGDDPWTGTDDGYSTSLVTGAAG
ncbi:hypothetical protein SY2F82_65030 [Streptomyces sp. Y2F8-2]|uniref:DUF4190 domain-containing protein n=1 Tax=Streptomyces sp. Y2F8-2 TaxID=2759675 RepID=UPI00190442F4|nr:DUF4190 domain-containing protein [Streptomyces sp. Y2F8-2]GHK04706.1 hypothetical protein SY2F82_65030 [Streptomyces sp. Y2F8-2]